MDAIYLYPKTRERLVKIMKDFPVDSTEDLIEAILSMIEQGKARFEFDGNIGVLTVPNVGVFKPE